MQYNGFLLSLHSFGYLKVHHLLLGRCLWASYKKIIVHFFSLLRTKDVINFSSNSTNSLRLFVDNVKFRVGFLQNLYDSCTFHKICPHIPPSHRKAPGTMEVLMLLSGTKTTLGVHELVLGWGNCGNTADEQERVPYCGL